MIRLLRPHQIIHPTEDDKEPRHQHRPIHIHRVNLSVTRPEAKKQHEQKVRAAKRIVRDAQRAGDAPGAPRDGAGWRAARGGRHAGGRRGRGGDDAAGAAAVEQERGDEEVGREEARDGDGDYAVEGGGRADVYEG